MGDEYRADSFRVTIADKVDKNGYLRIKGTFTRAGIFSYKQADGSIRRELRHPDDVFKADSMNTIKMIPLAPEEAHMKTLEGLAPPNDVSNFSHLGVTGENISRTSDDCLDGALTVFDKETINKAIEADKKNEPLQLSSAYTVGKLEITPGVYKNEHYDARQRDIVYGHVTLVEKGRAGSRCQIRADSAKNENFKKDKIMPKRKIPELVIGSGENAFRADALEIEENQDTLNLLARSSKLGVELEKTQRRADTAEGEAAVLKKNNKKLQDKLKDAVTKEEYRADLQESLELTKMADEVGLKIKDDFTPKGLKMALLLKDDPDFDKNRADMGDGYLEGAFGSLKRSWKQKVSQRKTLEGLENALTEEVSETEYEDHGNIE